MGCFGAFFTALDCAEEIKPAPPVEETADAGVFVAVVVVGCGFGFVIVPLAAAVT